MLEPTVRRTLAMLLVLCLLPLGCVEADVDTTERAEGTDEDEARAAETMQLFGDGGWKEVAAKVAGEIFVGAERGIIFYAFDTLAHPKKPVDLTVRLRNVKFEAIPNVAVSFYDGTKLLGKAATDKDGHALIDWKPPGEGVYHLTAKITGVPNEDLEPLLELKPAPLVVGAYDPKAKLVIVDLDHTVVDSSFFHVLVGLKKPKPMAGSAEALKRIDKRYELAYLTHRPDLLSIKSKTWLYDHDYPVAPLLVSSLKEAVGDSGKFKTAKLGGVRDAFPNLAIGIGDKLSDAQAYVNNGMTAYLLPHYEREADDMREMAAEIAALNGRGRLHVVDNWDEVLRGIFRGQTFPPDDYVKKLRAAADRVARREEDD